ncbi:MAG: hypothetical protein ACFE9L_09305 [Candidatus Hodarchaeota archaeon]
MSQTTNIMRFKCLICNSEGKTPNPDSAGEMEDCSNYHGSGFMKLDLDKWKYVSNQSLT